MGDPVAGNPTQYMLEKAFAVADLDWRFLTFEVPSEDFEAALAAARIFDFRGVMLAPPHRGQVTNYLDSVTDAARLSHQVNSLMLHDRTLDLEPDGVERVVQGHREDRCLDQILRRDGFHNRVLLLIIDDVPWSTSRRE